MVKSATLARSALSVGHSLLPLLFLLSPHCAHACEPGAGSFVTGNLNLTAPYGIQPSEFREVTAWLSSSATFNITGYNVSADLNPNATTTGADHGPEPISGWTLTVAVTTDVSLIDAANSSNLDFEATTLYIEPPGGSGNATLLPSWRVCAVVYPGLPANSSNSSSSASVTVDGTCDNVLSRGCIQAIQNGTTGMDSNGTCGEYVLPSACRDEFPAAVVNNTAFGEFCCLCSYRVPFLDVAILTVYYM